MISEKKAYFWCFTADQSCGMFFSEVEWVAAVIAGQFEAAGVEFDYMDCTIFNNPKMRCPVYYDKEGNYVLPNDRIYITVDDLKNLKYIIYQLGHEITHYFTQRHHVDDGSKIKWVEETICEAAAFYFLEHFTTPELWQDYRVDLEYEKYYDKLKPYYQKLFIEKGNSALSEADQNALREIDNLAENDRALRCEEVKKLVSLIKTHNDLKALVYYRDHTKKDGLLLDTESYRKAFPDCKAVAYLCELQENALRRE